jgi:hypothetical protein
MRLLRAAPVCILCGKHGWQTKNAYVASTPLTNRFVKYRKYWTEAQIRFIVIDNNVERDMYTNPIPITAESSEFFYDRISLCFLKFKSEN